MCCVVCVGFKNILLTPPFSITQFLGKSGVRCRKNVVRILHLNVSQLGFFICCGFLFRFLRSLKSSFNSDNIGRIFVGFLVDLANSYFIIFFSYFNNFYLKASRKKNKERKRGEKEKPGKWRYSLSQESSQHQLTAKYSKTTARLPFLSFNLPFSQLQTHMRLRPTLFRIK